MPLVHGPAFDRMSLPFLAREGTPSYEFDARQGTHGTHSHEPIQIQLPAAPLIVRTADDLRPDRQQVTLLLFNLSLKIPEEAIAAIRDGFRAGHGAGHGAGSAAPAMQGVSDEGMGAMPGIDHGTMGGGMLRGNMPKGSMMGMGGMAMDLSDYESDAFFANDRTRSDLVGAFFLGAPNSRHPPCAVLSCIMLSQRRSKGALCWKKPGELDDELERNGLWNGCRNGLWLALRPADPCASNFGHSSADQISSEMREGTSE